MEVNLKYLWYNYKSEKISYENRNIKFLDAVGPIAISLLIWSQYSAENKRKIRHIVPSLWQTTVMNFVVGVVREGKKVREVGEVWVVRLVLRKKLIGG